MAKTRLYSITNVRTEILKSNPPKLFVHVDGLATTSGWSEAELVPLESELSPDGILDISFEATPPGPDAMVLQALTPMHASVVWDKDVGRIVGLKLYTRSGEHTALLNQPENNNLENSDLRRPITTMAVGEEANTFPIGEGTFPKTFYQGEESPTTLAVGEEGPKPFVGEGPKPYVGEKNPYGETVPEFPANPSSPFPAPPIGPSPFGKRNK